MAFICYLFIYFPQKDSGSTSSQLANKQLNNMRKVNTMVILNAFNIIQK